MNDEQADRYDAAARTLQQVLTEAFPDYKWWVPTSYEMIRWETPGWGDMIEQDRLEIHVKRDGFGARVPCRTAAANDVKFATVMGEIAIYTLNDYRDRQQRT